MKKNIYNKFDSMRDNHINGNLTDFKNQVKSLTKIQLLEFILYSRVYGIDQTVNDLLRSLIS